MDINIDPQYATGINQIDIGGIGDRGVRNINRNIGNILSSLRGDYDIPATEQARIPEQEIPNGTVVIINSGVGLAGVVGGIECEITGYNRTTGQYSLINNVTKGVVGSMTKDQFRTEDDGETVIPVNLPPQEQTDASYNFLNTVGITDEHATKLVKKYNTLNGLFNISRGDLHGAFHEIHKSSVVTEQLGWREELFKKIKASTDNYWNTVAEIQAEDSGLWEGVEDVETKKDVKTKEEWLNGAKITMGFLTTGEIDDAYEDYLRMAGGSNRSRPKRRKTQKRKKQKRKTQKRKTTKRKSTKRITQKKKKRSTKRKRR